MSSGIKMEKFNMLKQMALNELIEKHGFTPEVDIIDYQVNRVLVLWLESKVPVSAIIDEILECVVKVSKARKMVGPK